MLAYLYKMTTKCLFKSVYTICLTGLKNQKKTSGGKSTDKYIPIIQTKSFKFPS